MEAFICNPFENGDEILDQEIKVCRLEMRRLYVMGGGDRRRDAAVFPAAANASVFILFRRSSRNYQPARAYAL